MTRDEALNKLGLSGNADEQEIKKAYRKLANIHHPDKNKGNKASEEEFKTITSAYEFLTKPQPAQPNNEDMFSSFEQFFGNRGHFNFSTGTTSRVKSRRQPVKKPSDRVNLSDLLDECFDSWVKDCTSDYEYSQSMESFKDMCEGNNWTFTVNGKMENF